MPSLLDVLGYAGNLLDLPGSSLRDVLSGNNPLDQWTTPFTDQNRATGRDVLHNLFGLGANEETGMSGWLDNPMEGVKDLAGFGVEMVADPLNFLSLSPLFKALRGRKAARAANAAEVAASKGRYGYVNANRLADDMVGGVDEAASVAGDVVSPMAEPVGQKLLGYTPGGESWRYPGRETSRHAGYPWEASATAEHPYGMFDINYKGIGEGGQAYGPGFYRADVDPTSEHYRDIVQKRMDEKSTPIGYIQQTAKDLIDKEGDYGSSTKNWANFSTAVRNVMANEPSPLNEHISKILDYADSLPIGMGGHPYDEVVRRPTDLYGNLTDGVLLAASDNPGLWESSLQQHRQKANLYTLDAPVGTADRHMDWDAPLSRQPQAVQDLLSNPMDVLGPETHKELTDMFKAAHKTKALQAQLNGLEKELGKFVDMRGTPAYTPEVSAMAKSKAAEYAALSSDEEFYDAWRMELAGKLAGKNITHDLLRKANPHTMRTYLPTFDEAWNGMDGEGLADLLMGKHPSEANLADAAGLRSAGVPGMKNDSHISPGTKNYVTWDPELIKQFRIRKINGEEVPINPMFGPVQQAQRVIPQIAEPDWIKVSNPMNLQDMPGLAKPAMQGAAYQALARFNSYGGGL